MIQPIFVCKIALMELTMINRQRNAYKSVLFLKIPMQMTIQEIVSQHASWLELMLIHLQGNVWINALRFQHCFLKEKYA